MLSPWFANPVFLLTLLAFPVSLAFFLFADLRRRQTLGRLGAGVLLRKGMLFDPRVRRRKTFCILTGIVLFALACAGPQWGIDPSAQYRKGRDVVLVLDLSRSMNAQQPTRRELAIRALRQLADTFEQHGGNRVALVGFAARARLFFPLTQDYGHLRHTLKQIAADDYPPLSREDPVSGTRIGAALSLAVESCDPKRVNRPVIVLLSDGDDPAGDDEWKQGVEAVRAKYYCVHVIGFGDPNRAETIPSGRDFLQYEGETVRTKLNEELLQDIARRSDGAYVPAYASQQSLPLGAIVQRLLDADELREEAPTDAAIPVYQLRYAWFLLPALGLFMLAMFLSESSRPSGRALEPMRATNPTRPRWSSTRTKIRTWLLLAAALLGISAAHLPDVESLIRQGNDAFVRQEYDAALKFYEQAEDLAQDPGLVSFNKAAAYYRLEKYKEAIDCYRRCLEDDHASSARRARAHFDLGNALMKHADNQPSLFADAAQAYRACLRQPDLPGDLRTDARHNLELAQMLWLKAKAEQKIPENRDNENKPKVMPSEKDTLQAKDARNADSAYKPTDSAHGSKSKEIGETKGGQKSKDAGLGSITYLPDGDLIVPLAPGDTLATLAEHARRIVEERQRQRNPAGPATLTTKDW